MILSCTGHRPGIGTFPDTDRVLNRLVDLVVAYLETHKPSSVLTGMAKGFDTAVALAAIQQKIPFTAAVPFIGQESKWPPYDQLRYKNLIARAARVEIMQQTEYEEARQADLLRRMYFTRNRWLVDNSDRVMALHDGRHHGGTHYTVEYAAQQQKPVDNLWSGFSVEAAT